MLPEPNKAREAALAIHALGDKDRIALLGYLDDSERQHITPLLAELEELGIPRSFDVHALLAKLKDETSSMVGLTGHAANVAFLQNQPVDVILRVLQQQSPATISLLLNAHAWRWKHTVQVRLAGVIPALPTMRPGAGISDKAIAAIVAAASDRCREILLNAGGSTVRSQPSSPLARAFHDLTRSFRWNR